MLPRMLWRFALHVLVMTVVFLLAHRFILLPLIENIERDVVAREMDRLTNVIDDQTRELSSKARDSAYWDQPWFLMRDGVGNLPDILPTVENFENTAINLASYIRTDGSIFWQEGWHSDYRTPLSFQDLQQTPSSRIRILTDFADNPPVSAEHRGLMHTEHGVLMVVSRPILRSNMTGDRMGTLIYGRLMAGRHLDALRDMTGTHVTLLRTEDLPPDVRTGLRQNASLWMTRKGPNLQGYRIINDIFGQPSLVLMNDVSARHFAAVLDALEDNLILLGALVTAILSFLAILVNQRILQPLVSLSKRLSRLTANDDYFEPIQVDTDDETGRLTQSINELLWRVSGLQAMMREIENITLSNRELEQQVSERTADIEASTRALMQAQNALVIEERKASLNTFTAGIAHEINNPVNFLHASVQTCQARSQAFRDLLLDMLQEEESQDIRKQLQERFDDIDRLLLALAEDTSRINSTVKGLRTVSHLHQEDREPLDVIDVLHHALLLVHARYQGHFNVLRRFSSQAKVLALGPEINQAFMNVILNAVTAMEEKAAVTRGWIGTLTVSSHDENGMLVITIEDDGIGADARVLARAFEPFFSTRSSAGASGLGLSITRDIIQRHGGDVRFAAAPGNGARIVIELPHADRMPHANQAADAFGGAA
jgi:signal transduction histidine kinase